MESPHETTKNKVIVTEHSSWSAKLIVLLLGAVTLVVLGLGYVWYTDVPEESPVRIESSGETAPLPTFSTIAGWSEAALRREFFPVRYLSNPHATIAFDLATPTVAELSAELTVLEQRVAVDRIVDTERHVTYHIDVRNVPLAAGVPLSAIVSGDTPRLNQMLYQVEGELSAYITFLQRRLDVAQPLLLYPEMQFATPTMPVPGHGSRPSLFAARVHLFNMLVNRLQGTDDIYQTDPIVNSIMEDELHVGYAYPGDIARGRTIAERFYQALSESDEFQSDFTAVQIEWLASPTIQSLSAN